MAKKLSTTRKGLAIGLAVVGIAGLSLASAAQLNVNSSSLGAGANVVASCQPTTGPAIKVAFTTAYTASAKSYTVTGVTLKNVAVACAGQTIKFDLLAADPTATSSASLAAGTYLIPTTYAAVADLPITASPATIDSSTVNGVAVVISN